MAGNSDSVYRSASFAAWKVSIRASAARKSAREAQEIRDQLFSANVPSDVAEAADAALARVHAAAAEAMAVWERARLLVEKAYPDAIEDAGGIYILRAPRSTPTGGPTAADVHYSDAYNAMVRASEALDELRALAAGALATRDPLDGKGR
jgi:hypothetical protein